MFSDMFVVLKMDKTSHLLSLKHTDNLLEQSVRWSENNWKTIREEMRSIPCFFTFIMMMAIWLWYVVVL